jgi:hypothetical protein
MSADNLQNTTQQPSIRSYSLLENYEARKNGVVKQFGKGETIVGFIVAPPPNVRVIPQVNSDGYIFPLSILKEIPKVDIKPENQIVGQTKKMIKTTGFKQGAVLGIALGAGYGFFNNKSVFYSAMFGMLAGGALGHFLFSKEKTKK